MTRDVAPEPPAEIMPAMPLWRDTQASKASAIAATEAPRSPLNTPDDPRGWLSAISSGATSAAECLPEVERSTRRVRTSFCFSRSRMKRSSSPLVSSVPATITTGWPLAASGLISARRLAAASSATTLGVLVRAAASILATGTGCDQRVGSVGFDT